MSSCWIKRDDTKLLIPEVSYSDGSAVVIDTLVVNNISNERGMVTVNNKVIFLDGFLKLVDSGKTYPSFLTSLSKNDTVYINMTNNQVKIHKGEMKLTYRIKLESDYSWWDDWW